MDVKITATGRSVEEALENAKKQLGVKELDGYEFKIIERYKKGILGFGTTLAKVMVCTEGALEREEAASKAAQTREAEAAAQAKPGATEAKPERQRENNYKPGSEAEKKARSRNEKENNGVAVTASKPQTNAAPLKPLQKETGAKAQENDRRPAKQDNRKPQRPATQIKTAPEDENHPALKFVRLMIKDLELGANAEMYTDEEGIRRIVITGAEACTLIGHHGETLDSFQYLANLACSRKADKSRDRVTVDIENYRTKREETLRILARRMANKALKYKKSVMLEPMNPYERRIIHSEIQKIEGVSTNSVGSENNRKIVIYLTDTKKEAPEGK